jgi:hypothetical protein
MIISIIQQFLASREEGGGVILRPLSSNDDWYLGDVCSSKEMWCVVARESKHHGLKK